MTTISSKRRRSLEQRRHYSRNDILVRSGTEVEDEELTSTFGALVNFLKGCFGTGLFAMPMAFKYSGITFGTVATLIVGFICTHSCNILVNVSQDICTRFEHSALSYSETAHYVFVYGSQKFKKLGKFTCLMIDYGLFATYFGVVTVYIVFLAQSIKDMLFQKLNYDLDVRLYMLMLYIPLLPVTQIRSLKYIVPLSAIANVLLLVTFGITFYYLLSGDLSFENRALAPRNATGIPEFFGIVIFAMEGIGTVMPVENQMRKPKDMAGWCGILNWAMLTVTILYGLLGFIGYLKYGDDVRATIALNLPSDEVPALIAQISIIFVIYFSIAVQFHVPMEVLFRLNSSRASLLSQKNFNYSQIAVRLVLLLICIVFAIVVPQLEHIISLIGCIFFSSLGLFFPPFLEIIYLWDHTSRRQCIFLLSKNIFLMMFALIGFASGTTVSIINIIKAYM